MNQNFQMLGLTIEQARLLNSFQYLLVEQDILKEKHPPYQALKKEWLQEWRKAIELFLNSDSEENTHSLITNKKDLLFEIKEISKDTKNLKTPLYLILLEATLFEPYFPLNPDEMKRYKRLKVFSNKEQEKALIDYAKLLSINEEFVTRFKQSYKKASRSISGLYKNLIIGGSAGAVVIAITAGVATPIIAGFFAPAGLYGAAAVNAGLAVLGGGAIAGGGAGMAGGMAVIVGGGAVIGATNGLAAGTLLSSSSDFALRESAKFEVVMRDIILYAQQDVRFAQEMLKEQKEAIRKLEHELIDLKINQKSNDDKVKTLKKSIDYLKEALKRNEAFSSVKEEV